MANQRREPVSYRPFRTEPLLADGLLAVARPDGSLLERASAGLFNFAAAQGEIADRQAARAGALAGEQAALAGRPDANFAGGASGGGGNSGPPMKGSAAELAKHGKAYLTSKYGVSNEFASGLLGQFAAESNFNTDAINRGDGADGSHSIGIGQWNGRRSQALRAFAASKGKPVNDFETQLDFAMHELNTTEKGVGRRLAAARSVEEATAAAVGFERPQGWTPQNPTGAHNFAGRLSAARSIYGTPVAAAPGDVTASIPATAASVAPASAPAAAGLAVSGGTFRPTGTDTIRGRAYDEAGTKTYLQMVDTELRSTTQQVYEKYRDDPVALEKGLSELKGALKKDHIFPEIEADYEVGFDRLATSYLGQARENLARKVERQDLAAFTERTATLETDQQKMLADFDPANPNAADAIASAQSAIDAHYDDAVRRGVLDPDAAAKSKLESRRNTALAFYGKQADALDADGVKKMRTEMEADFKDGGIAGLDGEGYASLNAGLEKLEKSKRGEDKRGEADFRERGDKMALRLLAGVDVNPADLSQMMLDAGTAPNGKAVMQETFAKISAGRAIRDMSLPAAEQHVAGLARQYGKNPTDAELRTLAFAQKMVTDKRKAITTDSVSYAEQNGIVPETPFLTDAASAEDMSVIMTARAKAAEQAATELGVPVRYLKAGEAAALGKTIREKPDSGAAIAGAIVAGAGNAAPQVLAEFGKEAPMIAEAGAIVAFGGSQRAAQDVIAGYGKDATGKQMKGLKPDAARQNFDQVAGNSLALAPDDRLRIDRAAASITRKRITDEGLDPTSDEALAVHAQAVQEAAGAVYDRGVQFGGFATVGAGVFSSGRKVLIPSEIRADRFEEVLGAVTDDDLASLPHPPKAGLGSRAIGFGLAPMVERAKRSTAATLRDATPVAVDGGFAFAVGDPGGDDPQWIMADDGRPFVLDLVGMRDRLSARVPGAFR